MNQVKPYSLWIGHASDCRAFSALHDLGIRAIVQLAIDEAPITPPRELLYFRVPLTDGADNDPELLRLAIDSVSTLIAKQIPTLVACGAGMSRSPAIVAAAIAGHEQASFPEVLERIAKFTPTDVVPGLFKTLVQVCDRLRS